MVALALVVMIRFPFLEQPVQGDDVYYLAMAQNALVDPLHPMQMGYTFQGARVSMAGYPHPPLNAYILALLIHLRGGVDERTFHVAYLLLSLVAVAAMYRLARRFTDDPLLATLLFASVPAFVVNGNSFEADLPFLAFWMCGFALYFAGNHRLAAGSLALAALVAYQAVFAAPILAHHAWHRRRRSRTAWLAVVAAPLALAAWQLFQRLASGEAPAGVLAGYLKTLGLLALVKKLHSAVALTGHLGWIVFPLAVLIAGAAPAGPTSAVPPPGHLWRRQLPLASSLAAGAAISLLLPGYLWWQRLLLAASLAAGLLILARWIVTLWKDWASRGGASLDRASQDYGRLDQTRPGLPSPEQASLDRLSRHQASLEEHQPGLPLPEQASPDRVSRHQASLEEHRPGLPLPEQASPDRLLQGGAVQDRALQEQAFDDGFLAVWGLVFFAGAVAVFFAGSARYLLPLAPAVILMVVRGMARRWLLWPAVAMNLVLSLNLAAANNQYAEQYRRLANRLEFLGAGRQVWSGAEWGLRYYLEQIGAEPLVRDQPVYGSSLVVTSELAGTIPYSAPAGRSSHVSQFNLLARRPLRLFGLGTRSGYSSSDLGVLPFDLGRGVLDRVQADLVDLAEPQLSYLRMNDPAAAGQLLAGFYKVEDNSWRWMGEQGVVLLKSPAQASLFEMTFAIHEAAPARRISVAFDGVNVASEHYPGPGHYTLSLPMKPPAKPSLQVVVAVDKVFQPPNDQRQLGIIVVELGWK